jgi:hypothetical protein
MQKWSTHEGCVGAGFISGAVHVDGNKGRAQGKHAPIEDGVLSSRRELYPAKGSNGIGNVRQASAQR